MPVVMLRDQATGGVSVFLNVHNPADTRRFPRQARHRAEAVRREITLVRTLTRRGVPVFLTGDLNDRHPVYCRLAAAGLHAAAGGTHTGRPGGCRPPAYHGIDWILGNQHTGFTGHGVDRGPLVRRASDHPLVLAHARGNAG
jgi:hypothetical protein